MTSEARKAAPPRGDKLAAFISYSRTDIDFVNRLEEALKARGIDARVDREDIEKGEAWWTRIEQLIAGADAVIFVLSPDSAVSPICQNEIDFAEGLKKRLMPIVARNVSSQTATPVALARLNWIFFAANPAAGASGDFDQATDELVRALETNIEWIREHTRLGVLARRWNAHGRSKEMELRGQELADAETWLISRPNNAPDPTDTDRAYITESRRAATSRQRRLVATLVSVAVTALALSGLAAWQWRTAVGQRDRADQATNEAVAQRDRADTANAEAQANAEKAKANAAEAMANAETARANLREAQIGQSRFLADQARQERRGNPGTAAALALEALPDNAAGIVRPYVPEAEVQLDGAWRDLRERLDLGHNGECDKQPRSAPTASASSPRLRTRRRGSGTPRPASRSASRSKAMTDAV